MRKVIYFGLLPVMIIFICAPSFAEFSLNPSISVKEEYNDNIFLTETGRTDDFITTINPKIVLKYSPYRTINFDLDYGLNFTFYSENTNLNDTDLNEAQRLNFQTMIKPSSRFYINISDTYERVPVDIRNPTSPENLFLNLTDRNVFTASPNMILPFTDTISTTIGYSYTNIWYRDPSLVNSDTHSAFLTLDKKFSPKINGAVHYEYYTYRPDLNGEGSNVAEAKYDRHEASAKMDYRITPSVTINGSLGVAWFNYQDVDNIREFIWNIGTDNIFKITENTSVGFNYGIHFNDSPTSGLFKSHRVDINVETGKTIKLTVNSYYTIDEYLDSDREDEIAGVAIDISRSVSKRIDVSLNGQWEKQEFSGGNEDGKVHRYGAGSSINYILGRHITTGAAYRYDVRKSDIVSDDYINNITWLQATVMFR